ncbi:hypothetical protein QAD02_013092 [Eretmocerus hayati]|uniref:Uncharacterized protein n=1 Tax=Eretmocerus hayati TaxID=131215 RepID=A0ACC2P151_9HYME|nr:hypothetical protein QAD02_013092 [Eretmocerus hayati]
MLLAGLWFSPTKPEASLLRNSFQKCLRESCKGVTMVIRDTSIKIRGVIICGTCDLRAKAHFSNMKLYSGFFGCQVCKLRGERLNGVQIYPSLSLLAYSSPLLYEITDERYFIHHTLLEYGLYLSDRESISTQMIDLVEKLLDEYISQFGSLYGDDHMNYNLHLLLHSPEIVQRFRPLWVLFRFPSENMNGVLSLLVRPSTLKLKSALQQPHF